MEPLNHFPYPGNDKNKDMQIQSPQTEESKRLSELDEKNDAVESKDNPAKGEGDSRGGNQSINQSAE